MIDFPDFVQIIFFILLSTTIDYDEADHYVFVGDFSGKITICKLVDGEGVKFINLLKGHNASIQCLHWDGTKGWLYSGSFDARIFVWYVPVSKGESWQAYFLRVLWEKSRISLKKKSRAKKIVHYILN